MMVKIGYLLRCPFDQSCEERVEWIVRSCVSGEFIGRIKMCRCQSWRKMMTKSVRVSATCWCIRGPTVPEHRHFDLLLVVCRRIFAQNTEFFLAARQRLLGHGVITPRTKTSGWWRRRWLSNGWTIRARELFVVACIWNSTTQHYVDVLAPLLLFLL